MLHEIVQAHTTKKLGFIHLYTVYLIKYYVVWNFPHFHSKYFLLAMYVNGTTEFQSWLH